MESLSAHYRLLLGLNDDWAVDDVDLQLDDKRVLIELRFVGTVATCPLCSAQCSFKDHAPQRRWRHLDTMQFETILKARIPRAACKTCGVKTIAVPWADRHSRFTLMFEVFAVKVLHAASSVRAAALLLRLNWNGAHGIMQRAVERGLVRRDVNGLKYVGIDEKNFGRGQDYVSVMTDLEQSRVLDVVPGRTTAAADSLWNALTARQRKGVQAVAMDMWQAFETSTQQNAPQADIVHDKFHIAKYLNEAVDKVRRKEHRQLQQAGDDRLTGTRHLWLFHSEGLSDERNDQLESLRKQSLATARAWGIKEYFGWFWHEPDAASGRVFFRSWYSWAIRCRLEPVKKVARMLKGRLSQILTWFRHPISNAASEGFNSRIQALKSAARGFRNFDNYRIRILFFCGKLDLLPEER